MGKYSYEISELPKMDGKPVVVSQYDRSGVFIGDYDGYYNIRTNEFTLYPRSNPVRGRYGKLFKHTVSGFDVKRRE